MNCPICHQPLQQRDNAHICEQHGLLISGAVLYDIRSGANQDLLVHEGDNPVTLARPQGIQCPHCGNLMQTVNYVNTGIDIDSCVHCHFRWLDKGELQKIITHKPNLTPQQMLEINELEQNSHIKTNIKDDKIAHFTLYRTLGPVAVNMLGGGRSTASLIIGAGAYGFIRSLFHSWLYRVLMIIIVAIFGLLVWYIYANMK